MGSTAIVRIFSHCYKYAIAEWQDGQRRADSSGKFHCEEPITHTAIDASLTVYADDLAKLCGTTAVRNGEPGHRATSLAGM